MLLSMIFVIFRFSHLTYGAEVIRKPQQHEHLYISNKEIAPDGFRRSTVLAGKTSETGQFPGPLLTAVKGERLSFNVTDVLTDPTMIRSTSIHWHGLFQKTTNYADGVAFVSQCPIAPNHSFLYDFGVRDQAGTFWYHSHLSVQYGDGLRGPIVVYDHDDPHRHRYDVDDESTVITLADWYHETSLQLLSGHGQPSADATLINGKGRYFGGPDAPLAVIEVKHGKRYRLRLISMAFHASHGFSIDGHNLTIIEVDGINTEPHTVNFIKMYPSQRYSVVLCAHQEIGNYRVRALSSAGVGAYNFTNGVNSGILRYKGAPNVEPTTSPSSNVNPGAPGKPHPGGVDVVLNLALGFIHNPPTFYLNNVSYEPPSIPVLLQVLSGKKHAQDLLPKGSVYTLPRNKVIEINFFVHGHAFDVVKTSDSDSFNYVNPVRRDATLVAFENQTTIRFVTDNPGPWFLHCHIDLHLAVCVLVVLFENNVPMLVLSLLLTADWKSLCPIYDALTPAQLP
ncbi:laccase [Gymnopus androsaceus JB14]|uniref:Laccase n=1 Tax=Gymnopus androsaceus JB14 TaxID=1447944 RepID=A0A6A4I0K2_9AGAR|nr:laccase [Gymnopus androsaceus JB14]